MNRILSSLLALFFLGSTWSFGQGQVGALDGWVALPGEGETNARAFVTVKNPTMYDIYLVSADCEVAGKVEFRRATEGEAQTLPEITVPAYGSVSMGPAGVHLALLDLKRALTADESIRLTLTTDGSVKLEVQAVVRTE